MASISSSIARIKQDCFGLIDRGRIESICREQGYVWRDRELDPATTIALFMQQVLHGNAPCSEVRHIAGRSFSAQAYCQARARLPLGVYQSLLTDVYQRIFPAMGSPEHRWNGHRTFHIDGSSFSMPDTPELRSVFGTPFGQAEGCSFPVAHLLVLFSASTGLLIDAWASHLYTGDLAETPEAHRHLEPGDIVIGDDAFSGYPHLAMLQKRGLHGLAPVHHMRIVDFQKGRPHTNDIKPVAGLPRSRWIKSLGKEDQLVEYFKPRAKPAWILQSDWDSLPDSMVVRELRRTVIRPGLGKITITLVTTLLDPKKYPASELLELRLRRWDVETDLAHLKTTMKMDVLRCKTEAGVRKELAVFCVVYNLVRVVMLEAARRQEVPVSRISFTDAYKWMRHARPGDVMPALIINPRRPHRLEPRCRKRRPKPYPLMTKTRKVLRTWLKNRRKVA